MAAMGVFTAIMYREQLQNAIIAKARKEYSNYTEGQLKTSPVELPKAVSYTHKVIFHKPLKVVITHMVGADEEGIPCYVWKAGGKKGVSQFMGLPNHTMHRILDLLKG